MATYDLGKVVGDAGEKGDDGSTVWNTSTAPTYANSKYTFTKSNLSGKTGLQIAVNDIIFYSTYYYIVSTVNTNTVDCSTRVSIKGSDASVTVVDNLNSDSSTSVLSAKQGKVLNTNKIETSAIATSFGSTPSDSKVPSEKLTKNSLDAKQPTLVSGTNIKTINNNSLLGSGNITIESGSDVDIVTSWNSTTSDSKVPSEKLTKDTLDTKIAKSNTQGLVKNDGTIDTNTYITSSSLPTKTSDLVNDGADGTNVFVANNDSRLSDARTPTSHTHGQVTNDGKISSTAVTVATGDNIVITDYSDSSKIKRVANILADHVKDSTAHSNIGSSASATQATINSSIDTALSNKVSKSQTSGLLKNDGTVDTTSYSTFSGSYTDLSNKPSIPSSSSDLSDGSSLVKTSSTSGLIKNDGTIDTTSYSTFSGSYNDLSDKPSSFTPSSHTHGNLTNDGKVGSTANYFVYTTTGGAITSKQKIGNITTSGAIGSTSGLPIKTGTSGVLEAGSFGTTAGTFAEGNHTHSAYVNPTKVTSWSSTPSDSNVASEKLIKDSLDAKQATLVSGTNIKTINNNSLLGEGNITIQGGGGSGGSYINDFYGDSSTNELIIDYDTGVSQADIVTSWSSTTSDTNVPSEKLVADSLSNIEDLVGDAITYINQ